MTTFYICRHGESENNRQRKLSGWIDTPLTKEGVNHARSTASKLKDISFNKVISSDLGRAFITAYLLINDIGFEKEIERSSSLREVNYGDLANLPYSNYPDISPEENTYFTPPNGESLSQMQDRVIEYLTKLSSDKETKDMTILIVAHDGTINALKANYFNYSMGKADKVHNPHDFVAKFSIENGAVLSFSEIKEV
jgi:broad specificity phosphatase PhoE